MVTTTAFIMLGFYLDKSYGMPERIFDTSVNIADMDKRIYNERAFEFKREQFSEPGRLKVLIVGNSFGRDFVNMTTETFDMQNIEIVYRDDLSPCIAQFTNGVATRLFASADLIVFASGQYVKNCVDADVSYAASRGKGIFFIGTKSFGYNLNWLI